MTVLFVTTMIPSDRVTGSEVVSGTFVEALRDLGHRVLVLAYRRSGSQLRPGEDDIRVADRHIETSDAGLRPYWWMARGLASARPYSAAKYVTRRFRNAFAAAMQTERPELVVVDHAQMAWAVPPEPGVAVAYLAHNVEHDLYAEAARRSREPMAWVNRREARRIEEVERDIVERASQTWALSEKDAASLGRLVPAASTSVFEMPATLAPVEGPGDIYDVATIGSWTWDANAAGLRWFVDEVVPLLAAGTRVGVAGAGAAAITAGQPNLTYEGRVPDARQFLAKGRVVVVPSVAGAGVQIKSVDAIGTGLPVVGTSLAMRGIDAPPATVRIADDPKDFAQALGEILSSPPDQDGREDAASWVRKRRDAFTRKVDDAVDSLGREAIAA